jgi:hypothetical protein
MIARSGIFLLCLALAWGVGVFSATAADAAQIRAEIDNGLLSLEARNAPLHQVMREIGEIADFETVLIGNFSKPVLVNITFKDLPVRKAVERLVAAENRIIVYAPAADDASARVITRVLLLQAGTTATDMSFAESQSIESGSEADVRDHKLDQLISMLQPDQTEETRSRAAMALANFEDERAVTALESALQDNFPAVRLQAINSLGRVGSEQASAALIGFLQNGGADEAETQAATRALSRHDTAPAREFLDSLPQTE